MDQKKSTILLVDDDLMNLTILSSLLEEKYNLMIARGGKQALDIIETGPLPDLVLLDIMMPDLDGYSVCTLLKSEEATKDIPVIFISAIGHSMDEEEGLNLGAVDFIKKPFVPSIVLARVDTQLKLANSLRELKDLYSKSTIMNRLIKYKNHQIEMILNHSGEGYMVLDQDLIVQSEYSKECDKIFGFEISGKRILEVFNGFSGYDPKADTEILTELFELSDRELREKVDVYLELLPEELEKAGQIYNVRYNMIMTENIGKRLLIVLKNITEKKQLQQRLDDERKKLRMIVNIVTNIDNYRSILNKAMTFFGRTIFEGVEKGEYCYLLNIYIQTHTLKGLFGQYNIQPIYNVLDKLEILLDSIHEDLSESQSRQLVNDIKELDIVNCIKRTNEKIEETIGFEMLSDACFNNHFIVNQNNLERIKEKIMADSCIEGKDVILAQIDQLKYISLCNTLRSLCEYSKKLSMELGKEKVITRIKGEDVFLDPVHFGPFLDSLVHLFRNIVDHGIEPPQDRYRKGKELAGRIECDIRFEKDQVLLTISDDGKGIDIDELKGSIKAFKGFTDEQIDKLSDEQAMAILLEERFSSIGDENAFSGGGMGLSAVKRALDEIEGSFQLYSEKDKGTRFEIRFDMKGDEYYR
ncbi:MAG TPA: response regulator [Thermotogota bacterium]|nr:response regulator [Thermotogota bacterium]